VITWFIFRKPFLSLA